MTRPRLTAGGGESELKVVLTVHKLPRAAQRNV